jgi:hypothetical protein
LTDQKKTKAIIVLEKPNARFMSAVAARPPARSARGEVREPSTPEANLETPYMMGKIEVSAPTSVIERPSAASATIAGAV